MTDVAIIFPGQGAQKVGMGKEFFDIYAEARAVFEAADKIIGGLTDVIFNGPQEKLTSTAFCQPAIVTVSIASLRAFEKHPVFGNINIRYTAGLSLGEYSALAASGALSFEDTIRLVERRSFFMEEAARQRQGKMAAVIGFEIGKLVKISQETGAEIANFNTPEQVVISGDADKVDMACEKIKGEGAKRVIPLDVSGAFHSSLMLPAAEKFKIELEKIDFLPPKFPIISNVTARPIVEVDEIKEDLFKQITSSVQWVDSVNFMVENGVHNFIEIGPGNVLKGLLRKINPELNVYNVRIPEDLEKISLS